MTYEEQLAVATFIRERGVTLLPPRFARGWLRWLRIPRCRPIYV